MAKVFSIEIDTPKNGNHFFRPLGRTLRGRFDAMRELTRNADASKLVTKFPRPIPGQRITLSDGQATIDDPLHDPEHAEIREQLEQSGFRLGPSKEIVDVSKEDWPTWQYWTGDAVTAGCAKVVEGELPKVANPGKRSFIRSRKPSEVQQLTDALREQNEMLRQLITQQRLSDVSEA